MEPILRVLGAPEYVGENRQGLVLKLAIITSRAVQMLKARVPLVLDRPNEAWFGVELMHKDIRLARQASDELATTLRTARAADQMLAQAERLGYAHRGMPPLRESSHSSPARRAAT